MRVYVEGIGLLGPGLNGWADSRPMLAGAQPYVEGELPAFDQSVLPATERRRAGKSVKLAVDLAGQAMCDSGIDATEPAIVFASTSGDTEVLTAICAALATEDRMISPMRFHNSVHNAASGYWTIAVGSRQPANAIALHELTVAAGLLEAVTQAVVEQTPVLLVVYDIPFPPPLDAAEPISTIFGSSMLLRPEPSERSVASLDLSIEREAADSANTMADPAFEALRQGVTAARMLPVLRRLAINEAGAVRLDYLDGQQLRIDIAPMNAGEDNQGDNS